MLLGLGEKIGKQLPFFVIGQLQRPKALGEVHAHAISGAVLLSLTEEENRLEVFGRMTFTRSGIKFIQFRLIDMYVYVCWFRK